MALEVSRSIREGGTIESYEGTGASRSFFVASGRFGWRRRRTIGFTHSDEIARSTPLAEKIGGREGVTSA